MNSLSRIAATVVCLLIVAAAASDAQTGMARGRVVDARTKQPLGGVLVHVDSLPMLAESDHEGRFALSLPPGKYTIAASLVGYAVQRRSVEIGLEPSGELIIELSEGAGAYEERVTVSASTAPDTARTPAGAVLHGRDLQALRGVMLDDPLRAVQSLPAATSTDDFYSEFAVRGSPFRHIGLALDGIPAPHLIHAIHGVSDGGSIAMVNSEALGTAALLPGSYPQRFGRRAGAQVELTTRDGNRDRFQGRAGLSGTSANLIAEGPVAGGRGAWVASVRRSYLDFLLNRIDPDTSVGFGFSDALGKITFDVNPRHQLQWLTIVGRSIFDEEPEDLGVNDEALAVSRAWLTGATWRFSPTDRFTVAQRLYVTGKDFHNTNVSNVVLDRGRTSDLGWRADLTFAPRDGWLAEFGGDIQRSTTNNVRQRTFDGATSATVLDDYRARGRALSAYGQLSTRLGRVTLTPGGRIDRWEATATTTSSPWITGEVAVASRTRLRGGAGIYRQFPSLSALNGINGSADLEPERARHADLSVTQGFAGSVQLTVTGFRRDEQNVLRAVGAESRRLADGTIELARGDARWANRLTGRAHGIEAIVRRDASDGLSGWIAYGFARHRYTDLVTEEQFWSDYDQRHTLSTYALYRLSNRTSIGAKFRYGSNYPIAGYIAEQPIANAPPLFGGQRPLFFGLTDVRNTLRLPAYARLDVRVDRTVSWSGRRVTVFAEVANVLNRRNERNVPYSVAGNGRIGAVTDSLLPIVPSAGLVVEF